MRKYVVYDTKINNIIKKRSAVGMFFVYLLFFICVIRIATLSSDNTLQQTAKNQSTEKINLYNLRGDIYDCNLNKLTNTEYEDITLFFPTNEGIESAVKLLGAGSDTVNRLKSGHAVYETVKSSGERGTVALKNYKRYSENQAALHILGYTDSENHGVCGIEKGLDEILYTDDFANVSYTKDAKNGVLEGINYEINEQNSSKSVVLTIDAKMQSIVEQSLKQVDCGAVVITEADTGKIKATASVPTYNPLSIEDSLEDENAPFLNRAFNNYSVGSVFKTCVAAAGLENSFNLANKYNCKGFTLINNQRYNCHELKGHGTLGLSTALAHSCNCFFYQFSSDVGAENIYNLARLCGFGTNRNIGGGLIVQKGNLPELNSIIISENALANFSIGQGNFTLSPLGITTLYSAICNNGEYISPFIIEGYMENDKFIQAENNTSKTTVMSENTAKKIKQMLTNCLEEGTGVAAKPETAKAGGKTATAQTGWIKNGREVENGWFCGFFEVNAQEYVITVLIEDVKTQKTVCTLLFKEIVDKIYSLYN